MGPAILSSVVALLGVALGTWLAEFFRRRHANLEAESARAGRVADAVGALCAAAVGATQDLQVGSATRRRNVPDLGERLKRLHEPYLALTLDADPETVRLADLVMDAMAELAEMSDERDAQGVVWAASRTRLGKAGFALRNHCRTMAGLEPLPEPAGNDH